jgi:hypothetical protein
MGELADRRDFKVGTYDYHLGWSDDNRDPATSTLSVTRNQSGGQPVPCFTVTARSEKGHAFIENRIYRDRIAEAMQKAIEEHPPD